jgi:endoglucanase
MKTHHSKQTILSFMFLPAFLLTIQAQEEKILVPQTGYLASQNKIAVVRVPADSFYVSGMNDQLLYRGKLGKAETWAFSNEKVQLADLSGMTVPGDYLLSLAGSGERRRIQITADPYGGIASAAVKAFYYNRCSYPVLPKFGGRWARKAGHPDTEVLVHSSAVSPGRPEGTLLSCPGGWYDAGDYNKYIVNSSITVYTLFLAYELYPDYWGSRDLNIPESGNRLPDILDETLFNLRWMLTMQDTDGGVYHKCTTKQFEGFVMPEEAHEKRYVIQKNTAASLDFAATMAHASALLSNFKSELPGLADSCRRAAFAAWTWCKANPDILYEQPGDIGTGAYGDRDIRDEWFWAGTEIAVITGSAFPDSLLDKLTFKTPTWDNVGPLGLITVLKNPGKTDEKVYNKCQLLYMKYANHLIDIAVQSAYPVSLDYFAWGSNSDVANQGLLKMVAYSLNRDDRFLHSAINDMNYLTGVNPTGYCFITGFGEKSPMRIHHRQSASDMITEPVPGFLAGGPNTVVFTDCPDAKRSKLPAMSYVDEECSYSTNEIAINWNAPLVFLSGAISSAAGIKPEIK